MAFDRLTPQLFMKRSLIIAELIVERIRSGVYGTEQKLPPERLIAEEMGVSRPSVREAISALHIVGILESRPGDGTYVVDPYRADTVVSKALTVLEKSDSPLKILQARRAMEIGVVQIVSEEASGEDLRSVKDRWTSVRRKAAGGDYREYIKYGKEFHLSIARATGNDVIVRMLKSLLNARLQPLWLSMRRERYDTDRAAIEQMQEIHDRIVEAIVARNTEEAITQMGCHFDELIRQLYASKSNDGEAHPVGG